ncbi:hypothetical protein [Mycobacteroides franklinii]|uniref:hypothetical protein n=1 Tax=Mycobacteroides franklinii TaxID=948102 RepID=UPI0012FFC5F7|nr:hypothetical protein [Mycobacteroides franklinii]
MSVIHYPPVPYERLKRQQLLTLVYALEEQRDRALKKLEELRELHVPQYTRVVDEEGNPEEYCEACGIAPYPCPTMKVVGVPK